MKRGLCAVVCGEASSERECAALLSLYGSVYMTVCAECEQWPKEKRI